MTSISRKGFLRWIALSSATVILAGCGKKGNPQAPNPGESDFPRRYPPNSKETRAIK